jgi:hypothetical protein
MLVVLWSGSTRNGVGGRSVHGKTTSYQVLSFRQALKEDDAVRSIYTAIHHALLKELLLT